MSTSTSENPLEHFPVTFFAIVMGLAGLTLVWRAASQHLGMPSIPAQLLAWMTTGIFIAITASYAVKWLRYPDTVRAEFHHPVKMSFFPAFSISLILLSACLRPFSSSVSLALLWVGMALHLVLTLIIIGVWIRQTRFEIQHITPAWFIPVVGNILVPIAALPHGYIEIGWFFFSIGLVFWGVLKTIFFYRIIFHHPLPPKLVPTLFILIAPPAVGYVAYTALSGEVDAFARILFGFALFTTLLLIAQIRLFRGLPFALSWWAYSFPSAAMTIASIHHFSALGGNGYRWLAMGLLLACSVLIVALFVRTLMAMQKKGICLPEPPES